MEDKLLLHFSENRMWHGSQMILPEHKKGTLEIHETELNPVYIPSPTQERFEEIQALITEAYTKQEQVCLTLHRHGYLTEAYGIPLALGRIPGLLELTDQEGRGMKVPFSEIIDAVTLGSLP